MSAAGPVVTPADLRQACATFDRQYRRAQRLHAAIPPAGGPTIDGYGVVVADDRPAGYHAAVDSWEAARDESIAAGEVVVMLRRRLRAQERYA